MAHRLSQEQWRPLEAAMGGPTPSPSVDGKRTRTHPVEDLLFPHYCDSLPTSAASSPVRWIGEHRRQPRACVAHCRLQLGLDQEEGPGQVSTPDVGTLKSAPITSAILRSAPRRPAPMR
jgi:hypothetical protein